MSQCEVQMSATPSQSADMMKPKCFPLKLNKHHYKDANTDRRQKGDKMCLTKQQEGLFQIIMIALSLPAVMIGV